MRLRPLLAAATTVGVATIVVVLFARFVTPAVDLRREPHTVARTNDFAVGDSYAFGSTGPPFDVVLPVRLTSVEVLHLAGLEVIGRGVLEAEGETIGLVRGWPPEARYAVLPWDPGVAHERFAVPVLGLRLVAPTAGFRGVEVRWVDGNGRSGERVFDVAAVTCAAPCEGGSEQALRDLGLVR